MPLSSRVRVGVRGALRLVSLFSLALSAVTGTASRAAERPEFWLAPGGEKAAGAGTQADPWNTPKPEDFDRRMREIPANSVIHFAPGTFDTYGWGAPEQQGFLVKDGWTLVGAGRDRTTLRLVGCMADAHPGSGVGRIFFSGWGPAVERVVVKDLTLDCNYPGVAERMKRPDLTLSAIVLMGREFRIERVRAIRASGKRTLPGANPESFIIGLSPRDDSTDATGYYVEDCEVSDFAGGQCSAIDLLGKGGKAGATGAFRRNRILLGGTGGEFAFGAHGTREFVIEQNTTRRAARVFNWDTAAPGKNLLIRSNEFLECTGWAFNLGGGGDSIIENNLIELATPIAVGVQISAANELFPGARPWTIRNNTFRGKGAAATVARFYKDVPVPGCVFEGNRIGTRLKMDPSARGFSVWKRNTNERNRAVNAPQ